MTLDDLLSISRKDMIEIFGTDDLAEAKKRVKEHARLIAKAKKALKERKIEATEAALGELEAGEGK